MKKIFIVVIMLVSSLFVACDEDLIKIAEMSAEINGDNWNSALRVTVLQSGNFVITGTAADGTFITITIMGDEEGSYQLSIIPLVTQFAATYNQDATVEGTYIASAGEVVLTSVNTGAKKISGEFFFTASNGTNTINVAKGEFNELSYTSR